MWLLQMKQTDGMEIMHGRNGREYRLSDLPRISVNGYCRKTRTIYEFLGCFYNGHTCLPIRDVSNLSGDTVVERYEGNLLRLEQIKPAGYLVNIQRECEFGEADIVKPEQPAHPIVQQSPLCTRDVLYGGRTKAMRLHYKACENEATQYVDVMNLYSYIFKYFKFPVGHPVIHVGDVCKDKEACLRLKGLFKCSMDTPERFYHPVHQYRYNNKLM